MKKKVVAVVTVVIIGMVSASAEFKPPTSPALPVPGTIKHIHGDKEVLEGNEGHIEVVVEVGPNDGSTPKFVHVAGASVQVSVKVDSPYIATIIPDEVSESTQSTVRITAAGSSLDYTFTVVNEAEPEQAKGKTIAQCSFYSEHKGYPEFTGTGAFGFDKQTVDNIVIGDGKYSDQIISTTRKIEWLSISGLSIVGIDIRVEEPKEEDFTLSLREWNFAGDIWYAGQGYQAGMAEYGRFVWYGNGLVNGWSTYSSGSSYAPLMGGISFQRSDDSVVHGGWSELVENYQVHANGAGYFDCTLSDEGDMTACGGTYILRSNEWKQISLPCNMPFNNTVLNLFPDIPGSYGKDWVIYGYGNVWQEEAGEYKYQYKKIEPEWPLKQGEGYWIIQASDAPVTLSMPKGSIPALVSAPPACTSSKGCFVNLIDAVKGKKHWDMIGYPFAQSGSLDDLRIALTNSGDRVTMYKPQKVWTLDNAKKQNIVHNQLWSYTGKGYIKINAGDTLEPWNAYWLWTLPESGMSQYPAWGMSLLFPKP